MTTTAKTDICNRALGHLAVSKRLTDAQIEADAIPLAQAVNLYYDEALETCMRDFLWPFATKVADGETRADDPTTEWSYSYEYPDDCVRISRILSDSAPDTRSTRVPYRVITNGDGDKVILTNKLDAQIEYVFLPDECEWPRDFRLAFSFMLAFLIAPLVAGGDQFKLGQRAYGAYQKRIEDAEINASSEDEGALPESQLELERS